MKTVYFIIVLSLLYSCKQRFYRAGSGSMEETIMQGESFYVMPSDKFERNDIVVFEYFGPDYAHPAEEPGKYNMHWEKRIFRLMAYSGDSIEIKDGELFVNSRHVPLPPKAKIRYEILSKVQIDELEEKIPNEAYMTRRGDTLDYITFLTADTAFSYWQRKPAILNIKRNLPDMAPDDTACARASRSGNWALDNYGPLRIPSPGDTIIVGPINFRFYHNIPGIKPGKNVITERLYFVLGDNRYAAEDSRYIGLISHSKMYGIVK